MSQPDHAYLEMLAKLGREHGLSSLTVGDVAMTFGPVAPPLQSVGDVIEKALGDAPATDEDDGRWDHVGARPKKDPSR